MSGISVIIPLYNKQDTIVRALESVLQQRNAEVEAIIVDDGSTDLSLDRLQRYRGKFSLLSQSNSGPSAARNAGVKSARYDLFAFLDGDDELDPEFASAHLRLREKKSNVDISFNSFRISEDKQADKIEKLFDRKFAADNVLVAEEGEFYLLKEFDKSVSINIASNAFAVNRQLFESTRGFDERLKRLEISDALANFLLHSKPESIGVVNSTLSTVWRSEANSQFARTEGDIRQSKIYCMNVLKYIDKLPEHSRKPYFQQLENWCAQLLSRRRYISFVKLYSRIRTIPHFERYFAMSRKGKLVYLCLSPVVSLLPIDKSLESIA